MSQRSIVVEDFLTNKPAIVFIDNSRALLGIGKAGFDFLAYFTSDPEFAAIWKNYRQVDPINSYGVFLRTSPRS